MNIVALHDARLIALDTRIDERGKLNPLDFSTLPFVPSRAFWIHDVPVGGARGGHAHRSNQQLLVCLSGRVRVVMRSVEGERSIDLDGPTEALHVPAGVWSEQTYLEPGTILFVLASDAYDPTATWTSRHDAG